MTGLDWNYIGPDGPGFGSGSSDPPSFEVRYGADQVEMVAGILNGTLHGGGELYVRFGVAGAIWRVGMPIWICEEGVPVGARVALFEARPHDVHPLSFCPELPMPTGRG